MTLEEILGFSRVALVSCIISCSVLETGLRYGRPAQFRKEEQGFYPE